MQIHISEMILHMAKSHEEMANIIEAKRHVVSHLSSLVHHIPNDNPGFGEIGVLMEHSLLVTKSITSYLNGLADLEEALADNLDCVIKEMEEIPGEE